MKRYRFLEEAQRELGEQIAYFDNKSTRLGDDFIDAITEAIRDVRSHPEIGPVIFRNVRKRVLRTFPYNLLYVATPEEIIIVAIAPHRRKPGYWRSRIQPAGRRRS